MEGKTFTAILGINGYKAVALVAIAVVGVYASKKIVDKFCDSSVSINADGKSSGGK